MQQVPLADISEDPRLRARARIEAGAIAEFADAFRAGAKFPPVDLFRIDGRLIVADGVGRTRAARKAGLTEIPAVIHPGDIHAAVAFAAQANRAQTARRWTAADRKQAAASFLADEKLREGTSDRAIAEMVGLSPTVIGKIRKATVHGGQSTHRRGRDGRLIDVSKIGKKTAADPLMAAALEFKRRLEGMSFDRKSAAFAYHKIASGWIAKFIETYGKK